MVTIPALVVSWRKIPSPRTWFINIRIGHESQLLVIRYTENTESPSHVRQSDPKRLGTAVMLRNFGPRCQSWPVPFGVQAVIYLTAAEGQISVWLVLDVMGAKTGCYDRNLLEFRVAQCSMMASGVCGGGCGISPGGLRIWHLTPSGT